MDPLTKPEWRAGVNQVLSPMWRYGDGTPSGLTAPIGATYRQTDANSTYGNLTGLLWNKVGAGTTLGTDWLPDFEGRWISYTPTINGFTLGTGGTTTARYTLQGNTITVAVYCVTGTTGRTPGTLTITYPSGLAPSTSEKFGGYAYFLDAGSNYGQGYVSLAGTIVVAAFGTAGMATPITATTPFTWAANDVIGVNVTYEVA